MKCVMLPSSGRALQLGVVDVVSGALIQLWWVYVVWFQSVRRGCPAKAPPDCDRNASGAAVMGQEPRQQADG